MAFDPFPQTRWTLLLSAREGEEAIATKALEELAEAYWKPVYAFLRRKGHTHEAAQDETQAFFQQLIKRDFLRNVHPEGGQFRNFLLVSLRHRLIDQHRRIINRQQRTEVPLEPSHDMENLSESSPEDAFVRALAEALVTRAMAALEARWVKRSALFAELRVTVDGSPTVDKYADIGGRFGMTEGAVSSAVHQLRQQFVEQVRQEVRDTVAEEDDVEEELRYLVQLLQG